MYNGQLMLRLASRGTVWIDDLELHETGPVSSGTIGTSSALKHDDMPRSRSHPLALAQRRFGVSSHDPGDTMASV
eukprot:SAG11_NODE_26799_length_340_cov_1.510373_1_plen_74_part_10